MVIKFQIFSPFVDSKPVKLIMTNLMTHYQGLYLRPDQGSQCLLQSMVKVFALHLNICSRHNKQMTFSGQKY